MREPMKFCPNCGWYYVRTDYPWDTACRAPAPAVLVAAKDET